MGTATFFVKLGQAPPAEMGLEGINALYQAEDANYYPKAIAPDGTMSDVPENGVVPADRILVFIDVPDSGVLSPGAKCGDIGIGYKRLGLSPAINGKVYLIDFKVPVVLNMELSEGPTGHVCENCLGVGYTW